MTFVNLIFTYTKYTGEDDRDIENSRTMIIGFKKDMKIVDVVIMKNAVNVNVNVDTTIVITIVTMIVTTIMKNVINLMIVFVAIYSF